MSNPAAFIAATAGSNAALIAAIAAKRRREKEEEQMVQYNADDLKGWEFKIVRSNTGGFRNYQKVQMVVSEEAKAGWELLEKFDDCGYASNVGSSGAPTTSSCSRIPIARRPAPTRSGSASSSACCCWWWELP